MTPPSPSPPSLLLRAYHAWKSLRLPWRKQFLVGSDLHGNTFWEFHDALSPKNSTTRFRRILRPASHTPYSDVRVSPQWHQWLRHTREAAPTFVEQVGEVQRRERMKQLAAEADERWRSVPSFLEAPEGPRRAQGDAQIEGEREGEGEGEGMTRVEAETGEAGRRMEREEEQKKSPWETDRARGAPGENWQPESWSPGVSRRGRGD